MSASLLRRLGAGSPTVVLADLLWAVPLSAAGPAPVAPLSVAAQATFAPTFDVTGLVAAPRSFSYDDLAALPQVTLPVTFGSAQTVESGVFTGPRLLDVLNAAGGPAFLAARNSKPRTYILATGADDYQAVIAWGEIDPDFGAEPVLVAIQRDGQPLGDNQGKARLVVPDDKRGGRHVATLVSLELRDAAPSS